ncbi:TPA: hypothetical protein ONC99_003453 [Clostridioides difficile]|nr:hypothetical protein [Clostridioides difficile]MBZ0812923.1 hypothetical protein [Clostridioides difficile]MBZ0906100.1 hypothetical protein [Clostridioides difficile]MCB4289132.1 hypothetical protein [Clostridioides difficile]MCG7704714.1 hypothetical protein [Clostridioides difficile]MDI7801933.1 hypothetical protein [Clostridioides difficile]
MTSFRLTIWNVNASISLAQIILDSLAQIILESGFRLTIWNVNTFKPVAKALSEYGFRLTIWNVN